MPTSRPKATTDDYFNDLSRDPQNTERTSQSPKGGGSTPSAEGGEGWVPRPKRIACILCRKRKVSSGSLPLRRRQVDTIDAS